MFNYIDCFFNTEVTITVTIAFLFSQLLAMISLISACVSTWGNHKHLITSLIIDSAALTMSYLFLGAWSGAACNVLCIIRHLYCLLKLKHPEWNLNRRWVLFLFLAVHTIVGLFAESISDNPLLCVLPIIAAYLSTISAWYEHKTFSKALVALMFFTWLIYDLVIASPVGVINDALPLMCSLIGIYQHRKHDSGTTDKPSMSAEEPQVC